MTKKKNILPIIKPQKITFCGVFVILGLLLSLSADAAVVSRTKAGTSGTKTTQRVSRTPTTSKAKTSTAEKTAEPEITDIQESEITAVTVSEPEIIIEEEEIIENKSSQFDSILSEASTGNADNSRNSLAEEIRAQRAKLDAADAASTAKNATLNALAGGKSSCDQNLRACMQSKCGNDFSKCAGDTDTAWGNKMDACRRDLNCTGEEYRLFASEIKADRDMNARVASYNAIVDCGNRYNNCIVTECGTRFTKCLGKKNGDTAISKCEKIAKSCTKQDSGLASRVMSVFGTLRLGAEKKASADQERLYTMRDAMRNTCTRLGAMFDDRSLDCVYTIGFYAGEDNTLYASKKAYAGTTFNCDQNWFGVDLTTFKENAFRLTRAQTSASSAMLGAGLGTAVGAVTSGALERSIERQQAEQRAKNGGKTDAEMRKDKRDEKKKERQNKRDAKKKKNADKKAADAKAAVAAATDVNANANANAAAADANTAVAEDANANAAVAADANAEATAATAPDNNRSQESEQQQNSKDRRNERHKKQCEDSHGTPNDDGTCTCVQSKNQEQKNTHECKCKSGHEWNDAADKCIPNARTQNRAERTARRNTEHQNQCVDSGGEWDEETNKCSCTGILKNKNNNECKCIFNNMTYNKETKECVQNTPADKQNTQNQRRANNEEAEETQEVMVEAENNTYQNEDQDRFLAEWITCNDNTQECKEQYPYLENEYWDEIHRIRVPKVIKTIIDDFKKACNDENGKIEITYGGTAPHTAPSPWQRATNGTVICATTDTFWVSALFISLL